MKAKITKDLDVIELDGSAEDIFKIISMHRAKSNETEKPIQKNASIKKPAKKKKRRKKRGGNYRAWTDAENEILKENYYAKKSFREIGAILERSEKAISLRVVKLRNDGFLV